MRRIFDSGEPLHRTGIGEAEGANDAVGPGLNGGPLNGVVAVATFVLVRVEVAFGFVAAADVLDDDGVAACHGFEESGPRVWRAVFAVRRAIDENWEFPFASGKHYVGAKRGAVAHFYRDVFSHDWR